DPGVSGPVIARAEPAAEIDGAAALRGERLIEVVRAAVDVEVMLRNAFPRRGGIDVRRKRGRSRVLVRMHAAVDGDHIRRLSAADDPRRDGPWNVVTDAFRRST